MASEINTIPFLRHFGSIGNMDNRFQGHAGSPLTDAGRAQPRFMFHNTTLATFTCDSEHHKWRMLHFSNRTHRMEG